MRQVPCGQGVAIGTKRALLVCPCGTESASRCYIFENDLILICVVKGCRINYIKEDFYYAENQKALL